MAVLTKVSRPLSLFVISKEALFPETGFPDTDYEVRRLVWLTLWCLPSSTGWIKCPYPYARMLGWSCKTIVSCRQLLEICMTFDRTSTRQPIFRTSPRQRCLSIYTPRTPVETSLRSTGP